MRDEENNPYLKLRAQKIARNRARLLELGLLSNITRSRNKPTTRASSSTSSQLSGSNDRGSTVVAKSPAPQRRSARNSSRPATYTDPEPIQPRSKRTRQQAPDRKTARLATSVDSDEADGGRELTVDCPASYSPSSVRTMDIHVQQLVLGRNLGKQMDRTGKAFVMEETYRRCCISPGKAVGYVPSLSFNKYSGVQEWKNDALFLWVNLGGGGTVANDFLQQGRQITWFGGSRMHDDSNVIRRLLRIGKRAARDELAADCGLVLWVRIYNVDARGFTPYICLGRLAYHSHEPGSRPLKFVWNLVDYDRLMEQKDESINRLISIMKAS